MCRAIIDENLKWDVHTKYLNSKLKCEIGKLNRIKKCIPKIAYEELYHTLADFLGGCGGAHPPNFIRAPPNMFCTPPTFTCTPPPPNIFAPYPRNYSIRGQAAYVPPNYSFLQLQTTPVLTFLMLSGTF